MPWILEEQTVMDVIIQEAVFFKCKIMGMWWMIFEVNQQTLTIVYNW